MLRDNFSLIWMLLFGVLYLNGNIFFNSPSSVYNLYKENVEICEIIDRYHEDTIIHPLIISVKADMVEDIKTSTKLSKAEKRRVISGIKNIRIIITDLENSESLFLRNLSGLYTGRENRFKRSFILINKAVLLDSNAKYVILHELYHLKDNLLGRRDEFYSDRHILGIIDTKLNKESLELKISNLLEMYNRNNPLYAQIHLNDSGFTEEFKNGLYKYVTKNRVYVSSDTEVFSRVNVLRRYLLDIGRIETFDQELTNDDFIFMLSVDQILRSGNPEQYIEMLFLMKSDITVDGITIKCLSEFNKIP